MAVSKAQPMRTAEQELIDQFNEVQASNGKLVNMFAFDETGDITLASNTTTTQTISFAHALDAVPIVITQVMSESAISIDVNVYNVSKQGFSMALKNKGNDSATFSIMFMTIIP